MKTEKNLPENIVGHIVVFKEGLQCGIFPKEKTEIKDGKRVTIISCMPSSYVECKYMRVEGGFGAYKKCMGRMLIGKFYKSIEDIKADKPATEGNTKCYPYGYIPELFDESLKEKE